ncbi:unnamed protein product [Knipowitschia caucasica]
MSGLINFESLEKELRGAVQSEERYQRENTAKLRAVEQRVGSYEDFRSLVLASHLKPLHRHELQGAPRRQPWNPIAAGTGTRDVETRETSSYSQDQTDSDQTQNKVGLNQD